MLALLVALTVSQSQAPANPAPPVAVIVSRRTGLTVGRGIEIAGAVAHALEEDGVGVTVRPSQAAEELTKAGVPDSASCEGHPECLTRLATLLHARVVVGVDLAQVVEDVAVHVQALPAGSDLKLADATFVLERRPEALAHQLAPFARQLNAALQSLPLAQAAPPPPATLAPPPSAAAPNAVQAALAAPAPSPVPLYLSGAGALAFAGVGAGFLAVGLHQKGRLTASEQHLPSGVVTSTLTANDARSLRDVANRDLAIGVTSAAIAAGLTALTSYLWVAR